MNTPTLQVELHLSNGKIDSFNFNNAEDAHLLLDHLNPSKVFSAPQIIINEAHCLTNYRTSAIIRIEMKGIGIPAWPYTGNATSVCEVAEVDFERLSGSRKLEAQRIDAWETPGTTQVGFTELELSDGSRIIWQVTMVSSELVAADIRATSNHLIDTGSLHGVSSDGGVTIINMAHAQRVSFYPGPPVSGARIPTATRC